MKYIGIVCLFVAAFVYSCSDSDQSKSTTEKEAKRKASERDLSINKSNAYSDLFLDSAAVEKFITTQKLDEEVAEDFRRFYNRRNFEYAWFSSEGLTEQALGFRSLYDYKNDSGKNRKSLDNRLDDIMTDTTEFTPGADIAKTELLLSWRFINYLNANYKISSVKNKALVQLIPTKKTSDPGTCR